MENIRFGEGIEGDTAMLLALDGGLRKQKVEGCVILMPREHSKYKKGLYA